MDTIAYGPQTDARSTEALLDLYREFARPALEGETCETCLCVAEESADENAAQAGVSDRADRVWLWWFAQAADFVANEGCDRMHS